MQVPVQLCQDKWLYIAATSDGRLLVAFVDCAVYQCACVHNGQQIESMYI